jgi:hypothetical protein
MLHAGIDWVEKVIRSLKKEKIGLQYDSSNENGNM